MFGWLEVQLQSIPVKINKTTYSDIECLDRGLVSTANHIFHYYHCSFSLTLHPFTYGNVLSTGTDYRGERVNILERI
mgnify:CR=1 FL=1